MKKIGFVLLVAMLLALVSSVAMAATWHKIGTSSVTYSDNTASDSKRIKFHDICADGAGNIYCTTGDYGVTIFKTDGSQQNITFAGCNWATKMVKGKDGNVYAMQNYTELHYNYGNDGNLPFRLTRLNANGTYNVIKEFAATTPDQWVNPVNKPTGIAVGGDGDIYWTMNGSGDKNNIFWKYDISADTIINLRPAFNNGWSDYDKQMNLVYTVNGWFSIINSGSSNWGQDPISATTNRAAGLASNPGWGRDHCVDAVFDPIRNKIWTAARGGGNRCIVSTWSGISAATGVAASQSVFHVLGGDVNLGYNWFMQSLDVNLQTGDAWFSVDTQGLVNNVLGARTHVLTLNSTTNALGDEGIPEAGADVMALNWNYGDGYALVLNQTTNQYSLYCTTPEPGSLLALGTGLVGLVGFIRRRK